MTYLGGGGFFSVQSMYNNLILENGLPVNCAMWKLRIPLKIKNFLWYLRTGVILTKDNLAKRQWQGSPKCCFCNTDETIQHLFFDCHVPRFIWNTIFITFGIQPPSGVSCLFGPWLKNFSSKLRSQILAGAAALCWAI